jgi:hypothetical protein
LSPQLPPHGAGRAHQVGDPGRQFIESTGVILSDSRPGAAPLILGHDIPNGSPTQIRKTPQRGVLTIADLELLSFVNNCEQIQTQLIRQRFSNRPFTVLLFHDGSAQTESLKDLRIYTAGARKRKSGFSYLGLSHPFSRMAEQRVGHTS